MVVRDRKENETMTAAAELIEAATRPPRNPSPYDRYIDATGVPVHRGYAIEDARTVPRRSSSSPARRT
jgi:hypothetical protein